MYVISFPLSTTYALKAFVIFARVFVGEQKTLSIQMEVLVNYLTTHITYRQKS